jgi:hypothetical protein
MEGYKNIDQIAEEAKQSLANPVVDEKLEVDNKSIEKEEVNDEVKEDKEVEKPVEEEVREENKEELKTEEIPLEVNEVPLVNNEEEIKYPNSWKKEFETEFKKLPKEMREWVSERELKMRQQISQIDVERKQLGQHVEIADTFNKIITPHLPLLQQIGVDPYTAVNNLLSTEKILRVGSQQEKLLFALNAFKEYNIDIEELVNLYNNGGKLDPQAQHQMHLEQRARQSEEYIINQQMQQQQYLEQQRFEQDTAEWQGLFRQAFETDPEFKYISEAVLQDIDGNQFPSNWSKSDILAHCTHRVLNARPDVQKLKDDRKYTEYSKQSLQKEKQIVDKAKANKVGLDSGASSGEAGKTKGAGRYMSIDEIVEKAKKQTGSL